MEIIKVSWVTGRNTIGIILAKNDIGELHVYMGVGSGNDEKEDIQTILDWGTKLKPEVFNSIFSKFTEQ
jgi:hypothetical protein